MEVVQNHHHEDILVLVYDSSGRPVQILPKEPLESLNLTYNAQGRVTSWSRGELGMSYVFDEKTGYLTEKRIGNRDAFRYIYRGSNKVSLANHKPNPRETTSPNAILFKNF